LKRASDIERRDDGQWIVIFRPWVPRVQADEAGPFPLMLAANCLGPFRLYEEAKAAEQAYLAKVL
jgi:hypothetical protein